MSLPLIIAHRGASADRPENTLAAFEEAWRQEADGIEGDFHLTRDGVIVCHHDPVVPRPNGGQRRIAETDFATLRREAPALDWGAFPLPTITEIFSIVPSGRAFFFEAKTGPEIIPALSQALAAFPAIAEHFHLISFSRDCLRAAQAAALPGQRSWLVRYDPAMTADPRAAAAATLSTVAALGCQAVGLEADRRLDGSYLQTLRKAGLDYHLWTVNSGIEALFWAERGVLSLTTNHPRALRRALSPPSTDNARSPN